MKINSISVKNYRVLEDVNITFEEGYCTISGKNNAGKSCILRIILSLLYIDNQRTPWSHQAYDISYKEDRTQWGSEGDQIIFKCTLFLSVNDDISMVNYINRQMKND